MPSEEAINKRQRRGYSDYRPVKTAVIAVFFAASAFNSIQFFFNAEVQNTAITMRTDPIKKDVSSNTANKQWIRIANESDQER